MGFYNNAKKSLLGWNKKKKSSTKFNDDGNVNIKVMSEKGIKYLMDWEGFELKVYFDVAGLPTIGVGHLLTQSEISSGKIFINGDPVKYKNGLTEEQVNDLLKKDLKRFEQNIMNKVSVKLLQHQFDALVSFSFNVGRGAFNGSTLLKVLNKSDYNGIASQLGRWVYSRGQKVRGLINRRDNEKKMWNGYLY